MHIELKNDLKKLTSNYKTQNLYLQSPLFVNVNRENTQDYKFCSERKKFKKGSIIAIAPESSLSHFNINDLDECFIKLREESLLEETKGYKHLAVFKLIR
tara:strand:- start:9246 stop:9545 length:300 start_codon:yes stop_codon:yes gene_type:complete